MKRALFLLMLLPLSSAQSLGEDPAGDHGPAGFEENDLILLEGELTDDELVLRLTVAGLVAPTETVLLDSAFYEVQFQFGQASYNAWLNRRIHAQSNLNGAALSGGLERLEGSTWQDVDVEAVVTEDLEEARLEMRLPLDGLIDHQGLPIHPGATLHDFWVSVTNEVDSVSRIGQDAGVPAPSLWFHDRLPDEGSAPGVLEVPRTSTSGQVVFQSDLPVRSSNGGPRTFLFNVTAQNVADEPLHTGLHVAGVPATWTARVVPDVLELEPGASTSVAIVVRSQGAHAHGGQDQIQLVDDVGTRFPLTIHYPETPVPSAHHDRLWIHTAAPAPSPIFDIEVVQETIGRPTGHVWMNTLEDDARDESRAVSDSLSSNVPDWTMSVTLGTGLEVLDGTAEAVLSFTTGLPRDSDTLQFQGRLVWAGSQRVVLGESAWTDPASIPAGGADIALAMPVQAATFDPEPGARLVMEVLMDFTENTATDLSSALLFDGTLRIPLGEYDPELPPEILAALEEAGVVDAHGELQEPADSEAPGKDSPGVPVALVLVALALLVRSRA